MRREVQPDDENVQRTVVRTLCGWCSTNDHDECKRELLWYEKHYVCKCECADEFYNSLVTRPEVA